MCTDCDNTAVFALGLCSACYNRQYRRGTTERANVQNAGKKCSVEGCDRDAFSKHKCERHWTQAKHPLYNPWRLLRSRNPGMYPPAWDDFDVFLADVGEKPTPLHQLRRLDKRVAYAADNVRWVSHA